MKIFWDSQKKPFRRFSYYASNFYRLKLWQKLREFERLQYADPEILRKRCEIKIKRVLEHSFNNTALYKEKCLEANISPGDFKQIEDLQKFPVITKQDLKRDKSLVIAKNISKNRIVRGSTSGTTGKPLSFFIDKKSFNIRGATNLLFYKWSGIFPYDRRVRMSGIELKGHKPRDIKRILKNIIFEDNFLKIDPLSISKDNIPGIVDKIIRFRPDYIESYASALVRFVKCLNENEIRRLSGLKLKAVFSISERLPDEVKKTIEKIFKSPLINRYSSLEFHFIASSCPIEKNNLHINTENVFLETVDFHNKQAKKGKTGKILITDLNNYVTPFIRYEIEDYGILGEKCKCGRGFPVLKGIIGRSIEFIHVKGGKKVSSSIIQIFLDRNSSFSRNVKEYQLIQNKIDQVDFLIVPEDEYSKQVLKVINKELQKLFDNKIKIHYKIVPGIKLEPSGKKIFVKSKLD